jgi:hypothetical protein
MNQLNSSISNSNNTNLRRVGPAMHVVVWVFIGLVVIDIVINILFAYPSNPKVIDPPRLPLYFEYGRSVEGHLSLITRADRSQTAPITLSGWYDPLEVEEFPSKSQDKIVSFYGFSHAVRLGHALRRVSDRFVPRIVGAPAATSNWAYGAYLRDRGARKSSAVVLAFMSANLPMITTMSPMTWNVGLPMPYTADRFFLDGSQLRVVHPPYTSFEQYVDTFYDPIKWSSALTVFAKNDSMYSSFLMRENILDHSSLVRLVRRAYGQRLVRNERRSVLDEAGYQPDSEQVRVAQKIIHEFAMRARSDGQIPVIFLVNNFGYSDYLFEALRPILLADRIPYLSSHTIVPPDDPRGYLPDSHFTDEVDDKLADALVNLLVENSK